MEQNHFQPSVYIERYYAYIMFWSPKQGDMYHLELHNHAIAGGATAFSWLQLYNHIMLLNIEKAMYNAKISHYDQRLLYNLHCSKYLKEHLIIFHR